MKAKDYEGCMKYNSKSSSNETNPTVNKEKCYEQGYCIAGSGTDITGMPKITGWRYVETPQDRRVTYLNPIISKVKVRGAYGRYLQYEKVIRYFTEASSGTSGSVIGGYGGNTTCTGFGNTLSCTSMGSSPIYIPGTPGNTAGYTQTKYDYIIDCEEKTLGTHFDSKLYKKWKTFKQIEPDWKRKNIEFVANKYCPIINTLPESSFMKYVK